MANFAVIETENFVILQSYETKVAYFDKRNGRHYRTNHKWSATTTKHINRWLESRKVFKTIPVDQFVLDSLI